MRQISGKKTAGFVAEPQELDEEGRYAIMEDMGIKEYIRRELTCRDQETALDFIRYLEEKGLTFYKDNCECWKDKIYYWVKRGKTCVCFIAINDPDEKENNWTVWSDNVDSERLNN